jgi:DNA polymerase III alpha subunit
VRVSSVEIEDQHQLHWVLARLKADRTRHINCIRSVLEVHGVFISLEDEMGLVNLVVRPGVYERYRDALRTATLFLVEGQLQRDGEAIGVRVHSAAKLR